MAKFKFRLGAKARDTVTGFEGTIIGRNEWLNGCVQYALKAEVNDRGEIMEAEWIDEQQVEVVRKSAKATPRKATGGPQQDAPRGRYLCNHG